ncbi:MAG: hypothetical protein AAF146_25320 [Bacteroidota bacterium]
MSKDQQLLHQITREKIAQIDARIQAYPADDPLRQKLEADKRKLTRLLHLESTMPEKGASGKQTVTEESKLYLIRERPQFIRCLSRMRTLQDQDPFLIVQVYPPNPSVYLQLMTERGTPNSYVEVAGNRSLDEAHQLGAEQIQSLVDQGWKVSNQERPNFYRTVRIDGDADLKGWADELIETVSAAYGYSDAQPALVRLVYEIAK